MREKIEVCLATGWEEVPALPTPVPGLVIAELPSTESPRYTVTHARSGLAIAGADHPEQLVGVVEFAASMGVDWTLSGVDVAGLVTREQMHGLTEAAEEAGAVRWHRATEAAVAAAAR